MEKIEQENPQVSVFKHYCKVCHRGFGCAGALGGHMRAHAMGDNGNDQNFKFKTEGNNNNNNKQHSYFLRAKTPRFHQLMSDLEERGNYPKKPSFGNKNQMAPPSIILPSPHFDHHESTTAHSASSEEEDLANCLVMLSNKSYVSSGDHTNKEENHKAKEAENGTQHPFQCKACKKVFNSHQALGGHRASHKKVKGCFAAKLDSLNDEDPDNPPDEDSFQDEDEDHDLFTPVSDSSEGTRKRSGTKMHECSVCRRVFSSGQALGGHKRCHWLTTSSSDNTFIPNFQYDQPMFTKPHEDQQLDLNLNLPSAMYLQQWVNNQSQLQISDHQKGSFDDEMKLRNKLSDLRDVNSLDGGWLQMGIASTADIC